MSSTSTDVATWQDKFAAITEKAEAANDAHAAQMTALATELEALRSEFADARWGDDTAEDCEEFDQAELDARTAVYDEIGYFEADNMIGFDHEGNPY